MPLLRPKAMYVDKTRCIECGLCLEITPGILDGPVLFGIDDASLEAMAACPTGAIRWSEGVEGMKQLDVRTIAPRERHPLIFRTFDELAPGSAFELVNDHDPKPLYYQFQAERSGTVEWEYLEQGPEEWRVKVGKTA
jgi:uncharacterized protein (DUF2249 family)/ferredoxin